MNKTLHSDLFGLLTLKCFFAIMNSQSKFIAEVFHSLYQEV